MFAQGSVGWLCVISIFLSATVAYCIESAEKRLLSSLPASFSNDKLPNQDEQPGDEVCNKYLGCFNKIPIEIEAQDPLAIKTEFKITNRHNQDVIIPYAQINSCDPNRCDIFPYDLYLLSKTQFDPNLRTIIISPGYRSKRFTNWQEEIKNSWIKLDAVNVIIVSWTGGNGSFYPWAVANTRTVARQITVLLYYLASLHNLDLKDLRFLDKIYLIGHSLGAHISAFVGKDFAGRIGRITGLDPAGPRFSNLPREFKLDKADAQLVDTLHTNGGDLSATHYYFGLDQPVGHIDIYVNNGKHQPKCQSDFFGCSHQMANEIYNSFLFHHLTMRNNSINIDSKEFRNHRMFAYRSNSYEEFHDGKSLLTFCPLTVIDDKSFDQTSLSNCTVPVDYVADAREFRTELEQKYGINFQPNEPSPNKFFFYTNSIQPYLNNHYMIKIGLASPLKDDDGMKHAPGSTKCDLMIHVNTFDGFGSEIELKDLKLADESEHKTILTPYLARNDQNKLLLADLDAGQFFSNDTPRLQRTLHKLLPTSLQLISSKTRSPKATDDGRTLNSVLDKLFGLARDQSIESKRCALNIDTVTVRPLTKLHRRMIASYTSSGKNKELPTVVVSRDIDEYWREAENLWNNVGHKGEQLFVSGWYEDELYLDTVILGPYDSDTN